MANEFARKLRREMTDAERRLWSKLRYRQIDGFRFRRQHPIGPYVADFVCLEAKLIVEIDGGQHGEAATADTERTRWLNSRGYEVLRFWNNEVNENVAGVLERLRERLRRETPHPNPPPQGGREN
jgi:very-short-patch-repair endonuclease